MMDQNTFSADNLNLIESHNTVETLPKNVHVTNIKFGLFLHTAIHLADEPYIPADCVYDVLVYFSKNVYVCKTDSWTLTSFNQKTKYMSITGVHQIDQITLVVQRLCVLYNIEASNIKLVVIESVSCTFSTFANLREKILQSCEDDVLVNSHTKFSGLFIQTPIGQLTYFNSGKIISMGHKSYKSIALFVHYTQNFFSMLNEQKF